MIDIREAKTHLSRLIERAVAGDTVVITKAGNPVVKITRVNVPVGGDQKRLGFLRGAFSVPDDFDRLGQEEINLLTSDPMVAQYPGPIRTV